MADEVVLAAGLLWGGTGRLRHVRPGAMTANFGGETWVRTDQAMRDGTPIFRRELTTNQEGTPDAEQ